MCSLPSEAMKDAIDVGERTRGVLARMGDTPVLFERELDARFDRYASLLGVWEGSSLASAEGGGKEEGAPGTLAAVQEAVRGRGVLALLKCCRGEGSIHLLRPRCQSICQQYC